MAHLLGIRMAKIRRHFPLDAPFRAGAARLRTLADRVDKALRDRRRQWAWWGLALLPVLIALGVGIYRTGSDWLVGGLCIGGFIDLILFGYALTYRTSADILLARDLSGALNRWRLDVHADSPLKGELDLRYPGDYRPKRTVRSGGGKLKEYNHYVPFDLKFALADGNLLALQVDLKARTNRMPAAVRMRRGSAQKNHSPRRDRRHGFPTPPVPTHRDRGRAGNQCLRSIRAANRLPLERR